MTQKTEDENKYRNYAYPQYVQGIDSQGSDFFSKDDNLFEKKIFIAKNEPKKLEEILKKMVPLFEYESSAAKKLRYYKSENGEYQYLSLVLMSVKEKTSLDHIYFPEENTTSQKIRISSFDLLYQIVIELKNLHMNNIIHGCLKPENIYIDTNNNNSLYIANFGLRQIMDEYIDCVNTPDTDAPSLSYLMLKGTAYEPPEMKKIKRFTHSSEIEVYDHNVDEGFFGKEINSNFYTAKMDVYAFGILFYEIMTKTRLKPENMTIKNDSVFPGDRHFPDAIKALITKCLSINPSDRPSFPAILSAMDKIRDSDDSQNVDYFKNNENIIRIQDVFENPNADILNLFLNAFGGDVESLMISFQILDKLVKKKENNDNAITRVQKNDNDNYGLGNKLGSVEINIIKFKNNNQDYNDDCKYIKTDDICKLLKSNNDDDKNKLSQVDIDIDPELSPEKSGAIHIKRYSDISKFVYPKTITVPLISYEISSLSQVTVKNSHKIYDIFRDLKKIALDTKDPNLLLYLAFNGTLIQQNMSTSPSMANLSRSHSLSRSISNMSIINSPSISNLTEDNYKNSYNPLIESLEEAAKYGSSEALVYLGCLELNHSDIKNFENINKIAYYFKVASDMYNPYAMINFGIMLEGLKKEEILREKEDKKEKSTEEKAMLEIEKQIKKENSNSLAGNYFILASQLSLQIDIGKKGLNLYNKEIELGLVDDEASRKYDIPKKKWVDWFLTMPAGRLFVHASEEYISKSNECSSNFQSSHQTVEKTKEEMKKRGKSEKDVIETDLKVAEEYGRKIHPMYSATAEFIQDIVDKYQKTTDFPRCPRVLCYGQTCFPVGPLIDNTDKDKIQSLNEKMCVHFYCPRCNDFYLPSQVLYRNISSIYFPRNYLPKAIKKLYKDEDFPNKKPFVQYVPTIHGIPMMEVSERKRKKPIEDKRDGSDAAGFFLLKKDGDKNITDDKNTANDNENQ